MCDCQVCVSVNPIEYVSPTYHHGVAEGLPRTDVCECGYWSCVTRGCGACPDCMGEHCECNLNMGYCRECGVQVIGTELCLSCEAVVLGLRRVECRECGTSILISRDAVDEADIKSLVCNPCEDQLMFEMLSSAYIEDYGFERSDLDPGVGLLPTGERIVDMD